MEKKCIVCGRTLPLDKFRNSHLTKDGKTNTCLDCLGAKIAAGKNKVSEITPPNSKGDPRFSNFENRELIAELRRRGYKGKLYFTNEISL